MMQKATIINDNDGQVICFPEGFRINSKEVVIEKIGSIIILIPKEEYCIVNTRLIKKVVQGGKSLFDNEHFKIIRLEDGDWALNFPEFFVKENGIKEGDTLDMELLPNDILQLKLKNKHSNEDITIFLKLKKQTPNDIAENTRE